jgi:hypothetical protein
VNEERNVRDVSKRKNLLDVYRKRNIWRDKICKAAVVSQNRVRERERERERESRGLLDGGRTRQGVVCGLME